jgi:hypothetical protein
MVDVWEVDPEEGTVKTMYDGFAETVKSALGGGGFTVRGTCIVCVTPPPLPVTVTV